MRLVAVLVAVAILALPVAAEEETSAPPECQEPNVTIRDLVVHTCEGGYWKPMGCPVFCDKGPD